MLGMPPRFSPSCYTQPGTEIPATNIFTGQPLGLAPGAHLAQPYLSNGPDVAMMGVFQSNRATYNPPRVKTPTYEPPRVKTPTYDPPRVKTPTYEHRGTRTPTYDPPRVKTPTYEPLRMKTPTYEPQRVKTPTYDFPRVKTPTYDLPRVRTPTYNPPRVKTPTFEALWVKTPTFEPPRVKTPTNEPPRVKTPTYDPSRARTPTYELPWAKTPTYEPPRVKTPTFEIPREKTFTHGVPHGGHMDKASDMSAMQKNAPTDDSVSVNVEVHHREMFTVAKSKIESEPRPSNSVAEAANQGQSVVMAAAPLKTVDRVKAPRSKMSGWSRLKKHMVVEDEPPKFPEPESGAQEQSQNQTEDGKQESQNTKGTRADKMWDAMLFQMFAVKEHLPEGSRQDEQEPASDKPRATQQSSWFSSRLPLLLFRPRFDARKLKEAAKGPLKRISSTLIESGLHRKAIDDEELKDFNRTAKGWPTKQRPEHTN
ncbi:proline-rich protein 33-like [Amblyraja radiata]|uniref:proline-rich protein 33-like n=1 Tax=Amblyraja radiata TaxID=386614 RepID=UPI0014034356|nr:proline-rich protein 33-like [Amblyraja radiata]